jgi:hypothetical protein
MQLSLTILFATLFSIFRSRAALELENARVSRTDLRAAAGKVPRPTRHFGLKAHIGVDSKQGHVHSLCTSTASVADKHMLPDLLRGDERKVWGDGAYQGQGEALRQAAPQAQDMTSRRVRYKNWVDVVSRRREIVVLYER